MNDKPDPHEPEDPATGGAALQPVPPMNAGDEAPPGTPGSGENMCARCGGSGRVNAQSCPECGGTGRVNVGIGGA